jgi:hypothetical protein
MTVHTMVKARRRGRPARHSRTCVDFVNINRAAVRVLPSLIARWLPGGRISGTEYTALNPRRADRRLGSFRVNLLTGRWADFATDKARGRDAVSLYAYLTGVRQVEAARRLADLLGISPGGRDVP